MPSIKKTSFADISNDKIVSELNSSMKASLGNINKFASAAPWRKHFRSAMSMSIG